MCVCVFMIFQHISFLPSGLREYDLVSFTSATFEGLQVHRESENPMTPQISLGS